MTDFTRLCADDYHTIYNNEVHNNKDIVKHMVNTSKVVLMDSSQPQPIQI